MIVERGIVTSIGDQTITVLCRSRIDCIRCAEGKGCGGGILARWLGDRQFHIQAYFDKQTINPGIGELVEIALPANRIVRLAAIMYALPLLFVVLFLLLQVQFFPDTHELVSVLIALSGLFVGYKSAALYVSIANKKGLLLPELKASFSETNESPNRCRSEVQF